MSNHLDQWIEYLKNNDKSSNTIDSYTRDLKSFLQYIDKDIAEINKDDIEAYKQQLHDDNINVSSINRKLASINSYVKFLNDELNIFIKVRIKSEKVQKKNHLDDVMSKEEFDKLIKVAEKEKDFRSVTIFYTLYYTGMRISETLGLKLTDINNSMIMVKGKGNKFRNVFIPDKLKEILNQYLEHRIQRDTPYLFTSKTGASGQLTRSRLDKLIKEYGEKAKIDVSKCHVHMIRHLFCKSMIDKNVDISTLADLVGHSDINTTKIYTRKTSKEMLQTINSL